MGQNTVIVKENRANGKPDALKGASPVWEEGWRKPQKATDERRFCPYFTKIPF
jgi:hypothetical protein